MPWREGRQVFPVLCGGTAQGLARAFLPTPPRDARSSGAGTCAADHSCSSGTRHRLSPALSVGSVMPGDTAETRAVLRPRSALGDGNSLAAPCLF